MNIIITFAILSLINVIFSTARSLITIKGGKGLASITSAGYFAFYNLIILLTATADFEMWIKCVITFATNIIGVYLVKFLEEKLQKDKLWIIIATAKVTLTEMNDIVNQLKEEGIKLTYNELKPNELYSVQVYAYDTPQTKATKKILGKYKAKYCALETQNL